MAEEKAEEQVEETEAKASGGDAPALKKPMILGRKIGMLQMFKDDGSAVARTVIATEQNHVTYVRTQEKDGYAAVQIGCREIAEKKMSKGLWMPLKDPAAVK